jgi:CRP-like cAMP-binding protein
MESFSSIIRSPLFQGISENEISSLIKCLGCSFKTYAKGESIYIEGDFVREIGVVVSGRVRLTKGDAWGHRNIISEISEGEIFAEAIVCGGLGVVFETVIAAEQAEICFVDFQRIISTCSTACVFHSLVIRNMIGVFARKNIMLTSKMEHITKRTTREKLLSYLSEQSKLNGTMSFQIPFDRQALADFLSVDRSALSAEMTRLKKQRILDFRKNNFKLLEKTIV